MCPPRKIAIRHVDVCDADCRARVEQLAYLTDVRIEHWFATSGFLTTCIRSLHVEALVLDIPSAGQGQLQAFPIENVLELLRMSLHVERKTREIGFCKVLTRDRAQELL